jgi:hypothetical protein
MDGAGGPLLSVAKGFRLSATQARWGAVSYRGEMDEGASGSTRIEPHFRM